METQGKNTRYLFDAKKKLQRKHVTDYVHTIRILKLVMKSKIKENYFLIFNQLEYKDDWDEKMFKITLLKISLVFGWLLIYS